MMQTYEIERDDLPSLTFTGFEVANVVSSPDNAAEYYSGATGRYERYALYQTEDKKYIAYHGEYSQWQGEKDKHSAKVCDTLEEVKKFFGYSWLAKELYISGCIDYSEEIQ